MDDCILLLRVCVYVCVCMRTCVLLNGSQRNRGKNRYEFYLTVIFSSNNSRDGFLTPSQYCHTDPFVLRLILAFHTTNYLLGTDRMSNIEHVERSSQQGQHRKCQHRNGPNHLHPDRRLSRFMGLRQTPCLW